MASIVLSTRSLIVVAMAAVLLVLPLTCCRSTVVPPPEPGDAVTVWLVKSGRHRGLALPDGRGGVVEYGYGDWDWYAFGHDAWYHAFDTVLWPTQGSLGRRLVAGGEDAFVRRYRAQQLSPIRVPRADVARLREALERRFDARRETAHYSADYDLLFVRVDDGFWACNNCNDATAAWLEELGCEVSWAPVRTDLVVEER